MLDAMELRTAPITRPASAERPDDATRLLLVAGIASSALYLAMDAACSLRYDGYAYADQAVSELNATGAPTRTLFLAMSAGYNLLLTAFGVGVWRAAGHRRAGRIASSALIVSAALGMVTPVFFPLDVRGADATTRAALHGPMTLVASVFILTAMGAASTIHGQRFRRYTIATMAILVVAGVSTALYIPRVDANDSTPGMGLVERANIYAYLLWVAVFAVLLTRDQESGARTAAMA